MDRSGTLMLSGVISGVGGVLVNGSGVVLLAGTSTYQGATTLAAGTLVVNGSIANSAVSVNAGTLKGNGTVGPLTVNSGTVAPGNSIGTLNVAGNVTFGAGSIYEVEIDPTGRSDLINASGSAAILAGSAVHVLSAPGNYTGTITYRIVEAPGGVSGTFSTLTIDQAGLDAKLVYTATEVDLELNEQGPPVVIPPVVIPPDPPPIIVIDLTPDAHTPNEKSVAGAIEAGGTGGTIATNILARAPDHSFVTKALDQLSGEIFPSLHSQAYEEDRLVRITVLHRLRQTTADDPLRSGGEEARTIVPGLSMWVHGFANWATLESDGNAATLDHRIDGVMGGIDAAPIEALTLGIAAAYTSNHAGERASTATGERTHVAAYGGWHDGALELRLGGDYGWVLHSRGLDDSALAVFRRARRHNPFAFAPLNGIVAVMSNAGMLDSAIVLCRVLQQMGPHSCGDQLLMQMGRAREVVVAWKAKPSTTPDETLDLAEALALAGDPTGARRELSAALSAAGSRYVREDNVAAVYLALSDTARTLEWLGRGLDAEAANMATINRNWRFKPLHGYPPFDAIVRKAGLQPSPWTD